jgi:CelD/BcsL family acetyltransferase involved in cellulose biosynthesis
VGERYRVETARSVEEVEALRELWERVPWESDEAVLDLLLARVRSRPGVIRPFAAIVADGDVPAAAAAGRVESTALRTNVGYRVVYAPTVRMLRIVDGGLVAPVAAAVPTLLGALSRALADDEAEALTLPSLPVDSALFAAAARLGGPLERQRFLTAWTHRRLILPGSLEKYLASRSPKTRVGIRNTANRLRRKLGEGLRVEILRTPETLDRLVSDLDRISGTTYQRTLGAGFADTPERRELARVGLELGRVRAYVLHRDNDPIAFWLCSTHGETMFLRTTGFDPAYAYDRVGVHLLMHVIEDACADPELRILDFGPGDAPYKRHLTNDARVERSAVVFARRLRALRINASRTAILGPALLAHRALDAGGLTERVRSGWRARLRRAR